MFNAYQPQKSNQNSPIYQYHARVTKHVNLHLESTGKNEVYALGR